jgi:hypothetical protein
VIVKAAIPQSKDSASAMDAHPLLDSATCAIRAVME